MLPSTSTDTGDMTELTSKDEFDKLRKSIKDKGIVVLCCANWYEPCKVLKDNIMQEMVKIYKHLVFTWIDCDKFVELVEKYEVDTVPTVLVFHPHKQDVDKIINPSPDKLNAEIEKQNEYYKSVLSTEKERVFQEIDMILASAPMIAFIKGTPTEPKCKFTRRLLAHFNKYELTFKSYNILEDERIRQWLKIYSNWPTYPQVYINKEFVGGIDVIDQLVEEGEFIDMVPKECKKLPPIEIFEEMLSSFDVVVIMEGLPDKPNNDASKTLIETLEKNSIKYVTVDYSVLEEEVKEHIKSKYSVDSIPQIFLKKKPFGNQETLQKYVNDGTLESVIPEGSRKVSLNDRLKKLISKLTSPILD